MKVKISNFFVSEDAQINHLFQINKRSVINWINTAEDGFTFFNIPVYKVGFSICLKLKRKKSVIKY